MDYALSTAEVIILDIGEMMLLIVHCTQTSSIVSDVCTHHNRQYQLLLPGNGDDSSNARWFNSTAFFTQ